MKALTILQPWASLIACGAKKIETRSWATKYRGPLAIHAGKQWREIVKKGDLPEEIHAALCWKGGFKKFNDLPRGKIIAVAKLVDCILMTEENISPLSPQERAFGHFEPGRFMWVLDEIRPLATPVPAHGMQGLWNWEERS